MRGSNVLFSSAAVSKTPILLEPNACQIERLAVTAYSHVKRCGEAVVLGGGIKSRTARQFCVVNVFVEMNRSHRGAGNDRDVRLR